MLMMKIIKLIFIAAIFLAAGAGAYYYSLQQVEFHDVRISQVRMKGLTAFTLEGEVDVHNGGFLRFNVKNITYEIIMERSGSRLTSGVVQGGHLGVGETRAFPFENDINILASGEAIIAFLNSDNAFVRIKGIITLANDIRIPFEKREDMGPYMEDFTKDNVDSLTGVDTVEMAKGIIGALGTALT